MWATQCNRLNDTAQPRYAQHGAEASTTTCADYERIELIAVLQAYGRLPATDDGWEEPDTEPGFSPDRQVTLSAFAKLWVFLLAFPVLRASRPWIDPHTCQSILANLGLAKPCFYCRRAVVF